MKAVKIFHILIEGRVQGVGYRHFAATHAKSFKINGTARNLLDGRVEVVIFAKEDENIEAYLNELQRGPAFAKVREIKVKELDPNGGLQGYNLSSDFKILPDEEAP